ncbi:MAG TPA: hypothetical protein VJG67_01745 [Candidatus Paceibacterota bacterium]
MSFLSFLGRKKEGVSLLIDIGNGSITGAFVLFSEGKKPKFLYSLKKTFTVSEKPNALRLIDGMSLLLDSLIEIMVKEEPQKIHSVVVSLSSPWFIIKTKEIKISEKAPYTVTAGFLNEILSEEEKLFISEIITSLDSEEEKDFVVVEKSIIHSKINGYPVSDIIGKKTKTFEANLSMSAVSRSIEEKIVSIISKNTHLSRDKILMRTFPTVLFSTIRDNFAKESDFILMDITGEITDIMVINNDVIVKMASFPLGRNFVIRQISKALSISTEIALSDISMYIKNKTHKESSNNIQGVLENIEKEWAIYLEDTLNSLSEDMVFPRTLYITTNSDTAPIFIEFLKLPKSDTTSEFRKNTNIIHINSSSLSNFYDSYSVIPEDEFVALLAVFYNKIVQG